jgi:RHS repeat-associated protein
VNCQNFSVLYEQLQLSLPQERLQRRNRKRKPIVGACFTIVFLTLACRPASAQSYLTAIGNTTFSTSVPVQQGYVNAANGDLHLSIPLGAFTERGRQPFSAEMDYDSRIWQIVDVSGSYSWQPTNVYNSQGGWRLVTNPLTGPQSLTYTSQTEDCPTDEVAGSPDVTKSGHYAIYSNFEWTGPDGTVRTFPTITTQYDPTDCNGGDITTGSGLADDSSGYLLNVDDYTSTSSVYDPDGNNLTTLKDSNGNYFSVNSSGDTVSYIDTLGRTALKVTTDCNGNTNETCYVVSNSQNTTSQYIVTTESISVSTDFAESGVTEYSGTITVVQSIELPDGTTYKFTYDSQGYGELASMVLPTLGSVTDTYETFVDSFGNANRWINDVAQGGGTWQFGPPTLDCTLSGYSYCQLYDVLAPSGNSTYYYFGMNSGTNGSWVGKVIYNNSSAVAVETVSETWTSGPLNVQKISEATFLNDGPFTPTLENSTTYTYESPYTPQIAKISEWKDYPQGSLPSTPDRVTNFTYYSGGTNILDRPTSITVTNGAGTETFAQSNITYDSYGSNGLKSITGVAEHDDTNFGESFTARGNPTSIARLVGNSTYLTTSMTYDTTGQVLSITDPNNNAATMSYTDSFYQDNNENPPASYTPSAPTNAFLTTLTLPIIGAQTFGFYYGTGQQALSTDQNGATTYYHAYDSFSRPTENIFPDGGWTAISYASSETEVDAYLGITNSTASTSCTSGCRHDETTADDLGRQNYSYLVSDPDGETTVATSYDTSGRISSVSNPYRATSNGQDSYTYDALNRSTAITHTDGTAEDIYYGAAVGTPGGITTQGCSTSTYGYGYPTLTVDEAGKKREVWTDGFGRTIEVDEPNSSGTLAEATCYTYDLNNNLLTVVSATGQTRSYAYDDLSRLTSVAIPETNVGGTQYTTTYAYTNSGLCSGNPNAVCVRSDARGITATYKYDALNRVTSTTYSDGTPTVTYCYDGNNANCISGGFSSSYGKGRRTAMSDGSGNTGWNYSSTGRVSSEQRTIAGITKTLSYAYNLDGSINTITYPSGRVVTYNVGGAQRPLSVTDSNGTQYALSATYAPTGALSTAIYGQVSGGFAGTTENRIYSNRLELTSIQASSSNGTALNLAPCYTAFTITSSTPCSGTATNNNGSVTGIVNTVDTNETQAYVYDTLNRISSAVTKTTSGNDCWGQSFGIDAVANLTGITVTQCSAGPLSVSTDGYNHLVATSYSYDHAGDMTDDAVNTYFYNAEHRVIQVNGTAGECSTATVCYVYDGDGLRVEKTNGTLYWRSTVGDALTESNLSGTIENEYVFFAGRRIARITSETVNYFYSDALGTSQTITNQTGTPCYGASFTPYGQEILNPNITETCSSNYKFTGYEYDPETGNYYAIGRYYSWRLGRFLTVDPAEGTELNPQTLNRYAYVSNACTMFSDPSGLGGSPCPLIIAGAGDNRKNSPDLIKFAEDIGATLVFPEPNEASADVMLGITVLASTSPVIEFGGAPAAAYPYSASGMAAVQEGIADASGPSGGPSTVIAWSLGSGYYNEAAASTPNSTPGNMAYVMPYMPGTSPVYGTSGTFLYTGTGGTNRYLQSGGNAVPGAIQIATDSGHSQSVFPTLDPTTNMNTPGRQLAYAPYLGSSKSSCHFRTITAGGSTSAPYELLPITGCGSEGCSVIWWVYYYF